MKLRVWDLPTRLFHWSLAALVLALAISGQIGAMTWHFRFGYAVFTLLLFRVVWGLVGGHWSRFASFIYAPSTIVAYLKGQGKPAHEIGHNPLGAFSVFGLLGFLSFQVASGLFADDEIANAGPLTKFISNAWVSDLTWYHKAVGKWVLLAMVLLHIAAIIFYLRAKKHNLILPMLHGDKEVQSVGLPVSKDGIAQRLLALVVALACGGLVAWVVKLGG
jgi:cytochrome b